MTVRVCVSDADTSAEQWALPALRHQPDRHGLSNLLDCQSTCLVGLDEGHGDIKSASGPIGQRAHRPGYHWEEERSVRTQQQIQVQLLFAHVSDRKLTKFTGTETGLDGSISFTGFGTQRILRD